MRGRLPVEPVLLAELQARLGDDLLDVSLEVGGRVEQRAEAGHVPALHPSHLKEAGRVLVRDHVYRLQEDAIEQCLGLGGAAVNAGGELSRPVALEGTLADPRRLGIIGMQERAVSIGAQFRLSSAPGAGTSVAVTLPTHATEAQGR